jgi:ubiquinone/menaquinone biosynthesis C-methylase UbiE
MAKRLPSSLTRLPISLLTLGFATAIPATMPAAESLPLQSTPQYEYRAVHDPNGIGKFYLGREIARVMGHEGADWLERPEREQEEQTDRMIQTLDLKPGEKVADIGAGTGYITRRLARAVAPDGTVFAVDIQPEMLTLLTNQFTHAGITNVQPVLGTLTDPKLPGNTLDRVIMVDVYHEFSHPWEMLDAITRSLKPGGQVIFVEYRAEDPSVPIKRVHKMSEAQVRKEAAMHSLEWVRTIDALPWQHVIICRKKTGNSP